MPARVSKRGDKYRVVHGPGKGKLVRNRAGTPVDGGGHSSKSKAQRQANVVNAK